MIPSLSTSRWCVVSVLAQNGCRASPRWMLHIGGGWEPVTLWRWCSVITEVRPPTRRCHHIWTSNYCSAAVCYQQCEDSWKKTWWTEHVLFWLCLPAAGETSHFTCDNRDHKMVFHISVYLFVCFLELQLTIIFIIYFISSVWLKFYCSETDNSLIINKRSLKFVWGFRPTVLELHHFEHNMNNFKNSEQLFRLKLKPETWVMFVKSATIFRGAAVNTLQYFTFPS